MNRPVLSLQLLLASLALTLAGSARAELTLDPAFNAAGAVPGIVSLDLGNREDKGLAVAVQANGDLLIAGYRVQAVTGGFGSVATVARFGPDGLADAGFGVDGVVDLDLFGAIPASGGGQAGAVLLRPADQKIIVAGTYVESAASRRVFVLRLNTDGSLDTDFGTDGVTLLSDPALASANVRRAALQSDGGIIVVGDSSPPASATAGFVARFTPDGALDAGFAGGGIYTTGDPASPGLNFLLFDIVVQGDDGILVAGGSVNLTAIRLDATGSPDLLFGDNGFASVNVIAGVAGTDQDSFDRATSVAVYADGRIVLGGFAQTDPNAFEYDAVLARLSASGELDAGFGAGGVRLLGDPAAVELITALTVRDAGDIVAVGDLAFRPTQVSGSGASFVTLPGEFSPAPLSGIATDADGRILAAGDQPVGGSTLNTAQVLVRFSVTDLVDGTDTTPGAFSFADRGNVAQSVTVTSAPVVITGIDAAAPISVSGGEYSIGCTSSFTTAPGTILSGQTVCVRHVSAVGIGTAVNTVLTVGGVSDTFTSTTTPFGPDTPFEDRLDVRLGTTVTSNAFTIAGLGAPIAISVSNGEYSIGCGPNWTRTPGTITDGDTLCLRHISPEQLATPTVTTVNLGGTLYTFTSVTTADRPLPGTSGMDLLTLLLLMALVLHGFRAQASRGSTVRTRTTN